MMAGWMAYATLVGAVLVAGAWAVERGAKLYRLPSRFGWAGARLYLTSGLGPAVTGLGGGGLVLPDGCGR